MGPLGTQTDYLKNEEAITAIMASGSRSNSVCRRKKMMDRFFAHPITTGRGGRFTFFFEVIDIYSVARWHEC